MVRPHPANQSNPERCQTTAGRLSELNERHTTTSNFVQWAWGHVEPSSKAVDQPATTTVTRPCFAAANQHQTENSALVLTIGSKWRRFYQQMINAVPVPSLTEVKCSQLGYSQSVNCTDSSSTFWKTQVVVDSRSGLGKDTFTPSRFYNTVSVGKEIGLATMEKK